MHDQRDPTSSPREPATPPPLPRRFEPRIELRIEPAPRPQLGDGTRTFFSSQRRLALCYGVGGFLAGVVFWHAVGFWHLIHSTIFAGTPVEVSNKASAGRFADTIDRAISASSPPGEPAVITTGTVTPASEKAPARFDGTEAGTAAAGTNNCASFTKDPATGEIRSRPCSGKDRVLPHNANGKRENFALQMPTETERRWPSYMAKGVTD